MQHQNIQKCFFNSIGFQRNSFIVHCFFLAIFATSVNFQRCLSIFQNSLGFFNPWENHWNINVFWRCFFKWLFCEIFHFHWYSQEVLGNAWFFIVWVLWGFTNSLNFSMMFINLLIFQSIFFKTYSIELRTHFFEWLLLIVFFKPWFPLILAGNPRSALDVQCTVLRLPNVDVAVMHGFMMFYGVVLLWHGLSVLSFVLASQSVTAHWNGPLKACASMHGLSVLHCASSPESGHHTTTSHRITCPHNLPPNITTT